MSEEDIRNYNKYISEVDITKYIILDKDENYWYSAEYVDKMLNKKDKEIEKLNNIITELEKYIDEDDWTSVNGEIAIRLIKLKLQELKGSD